MQHVYLPFTSFLVIFGDVMSRPDSAESRSDLKRLYENVEYYKKIGGQYDTSKPKKLAASFANIAEEAVQKAVKTPPKLGNNNDVSTIDVNVDIPSIIPSADYVHGSPVVASSLTSPFPAAPYLSTMDDTDQKDKSFLQYLNWPQHPDLDWDGLAMEGYASRFNQPTQSTDENQCNVDAPMMGDLMTLAGDQAKQQPLDISFDCFSWISR